LRSYVERWVARLVDATLLIGVRLSAETNVRVTSNDREGLAHRSGVSVRSR